MPELDEKREEAIVEAVLFTMGKSVELRQLAAALGTDTERAEAAVRRLQSRYEAEKRGMQITQLEDSWQMATRAEYYENLIRVAATPKKQILMDVVIAPTEPEAPVTIEKKYAYAGRAKVTVNGKAVDFQTYTIDDYTYFKLRDVAGAVNGTAKQFQTYWDESKQAIELFRGVPYSSSVSGAAGRYGDTYGTTSTAKLYCDGERKSVSAYTINDYTYYKLRDFASALDVGLTWEEGSATIGINTAKSYQ